MIIAQSINSLISIYGVSGSHGLFIENMEISGRSESPERLDKLTMIALNNILIKILFHPMKQAKRLKSFVSSKIGNNRGTTVVQEDNTDNTDMPGGGYYKQMGGATTDEQYNSIAGSLMSIIEKLKKILKLIKNNSLN